MVLVYRVDIDRLMDTVMVGNLINLETVVIITVDVRRYVMCSMDTVAVVLAIENMDDIAPTLTNVVVIHAEIVENVWTK